MMADVPVGAFLSGGVDSTGIVAFAREQAPDMRCFTIRTRDGRDEGETDDLPFAQMAADHLDVPLDIIDVDADQIPRDIEKMIWHLDEPIPDPASLNRFIFQNWPIKMALRYCFLALAAMIYSVAIGVIMLWLSVSTLTGCHLRYGAGLLKCFSLCQRAVAWHGGAIN